MASITIIFYGGLRYDAGERTRIVEVDADSLPISEVIESLVASHPQLQGRLKNVAYAVGNDVVDTSFVVKNGDELSLLPPVSGG